MKMKPISYWLALVIILGCNTSFDPSGQQSYGLGKNVDGNGPKVVFDVLAKPLPEIPLPNDVATRIDPHSPTKRRLNISLNAATEYERRARREFNRFDGFGTYGPITISFDAPLDLSVFKARHQNTDFRDDAIYLLNVTPSCGRYGEEVYLDMGSGRFPVIHYSRERLRYDPLAPNGYRFDGGSPLFEFDSLGASRNLLFSQVNEDRNGDGVLSPNEDLDQDGVIDVANLWDPKACDDSTPEACSTRCDNDACFQNCLLEHDRCIADNLLTFYERETNTLVLKPLWPLEQRCTYAVVITDRVVGEDGDPIRSPFDGVHHRAQRNALKPVKNLLSRYGLSNDSIRFAWSFTTGSMTADVEAIRAGLYGHGPFKTLSTQYPADWSLWSANPSAESAMEKAQVIHDEDCSASAMSIFWKVGVGEFEPNLCAIEADSSSIGGIFGGTFEAPNLLFDREGIATPKYPSDHDEVWSVDAHNGYIEHEPTTVTFWCALPKKADGCEPGNPTNARFCPPYPTAIFAHGYGGSRLAAREHLGRHTSMGMAICAMDGPGHGDNVLKDSPIYGAAFTLSSSYFRRYGLDGFADMLITGRDRDLNNDGLADSGGDMWTADLFHTRDMVRQSVIEHMQFVRVLRSLSDDNADFDGDGYPDLAGPSGLLGMWGISLGGVISGVMAGAEPALDAAAPNAGGAGLVDIAVRSKQAGVPDAVMLPMIGPFIAGCLPTDAHQNPLSADDSTEQNCVGGDGEEISGDTLRLAFIVNDVANARLLPFNKVVGVQPGDRIHLHNLDNDEMRWTHVNERGFFRVAVPSDAMDPVDRRALFGLEDGDDEPMVASDTAQLGDRVVLTIYEGQSETIRHVINTFGEDISFQGTLYPKDAPLVVMQEGHAHKRNNPRLRRFMGLAQHGISQADPAVWGAHTYLEPLDTDYDPFGRRGGDTRVLLLPTIGDIQVPTNTGVAMARVTGIFGSWKRDETIGPEYGWRQLLKPDPRFGKTIDEHLVDNFVIEGDGRLQRFAENPVNPNTLFDVDNWSDGTARFSCGASDWSGANGESRCPTDKQTTGPACGTDADCPDPNHGCMKGQCEYIFPVPTPEEPLRQNHARGDGTFDAFRMPILRPAGQHGIYNSQPFRIFDHDTYAANFAIRFLATGGRAVDDVTGCDCSASSVPDYFLSNEPDAPTSLGARACTENDLKICSDRCLRAWDIRTPNVVSCQP